DRPPPGRPGLAGLVGDVGQQVLRVVQAARPLVLRGRLREEGCRVPRRRQGVRGRLAPRRGRGGAGPGTPDRHVALGTAGLLWIHDLLERAAMVAVRSKGVTFEAFAPSIRYDDCDGDRSERTARQDGDRPAGRRGIRGAGAEPYRTRGRRRGALDDGGPDHGGG